MFCCECSHKAANQAYLHYDLLVLLGNDNALKDGNSALLFELEARTGVGVANVELPGDLRDALIYTS